MADDLEELEELEHQARIRYGLWHEMAGKVGGWDAAASFLAQKAGALFVNGYDDEATMLRNLAKDLRQSEERAALLEAAHQAEHKSMDAGRAYVDADDRNETIRDLQAMLVAMDEDLEYLPEQWASAKHWRDRLAQILKRAEKK